jgi:hypothetical protein
VLQQVNDQIPCDSSQPAPKGTAFLGRIPAVDAFTHRYEQLLQHVSRIRVLQSASPQQSISHWLIKGYELHPGLVILGITQAKQQASAGGGGKCHGRFLSVYTAENGRRYTKKDILSQQLVRRWHTILIAIGIQG